jgi:hypothetical protein
MGFRDARDRLVDALRHGRYEHEARHARAEKNLLAIGDVSAETVITLLYRCRGDQHEESVHHWDPSTTVHEFKPVVDDERWYIKAYFAPDDESAGATIISVHR